MLIPHDTTILLVDGAHARILRNAGNEATPELQLLDERAQKNPPNRAMATDAPGRSFGSAVPRRSAYPDADYHERGEAAFGLETLEMLDALGRSRMPLILIAPPRMLATLRKALAHGKHPPVLAEIAKDHVQSDLTTLLRVLRDHR